MRGSRRSHPESLRTGFLLGRCLLWPGVPRPLQGVGTGRAQNGRRAYGGGSAQSDGLFVWKQPQNQNGVLQMQCNSCDAPSRSRTAETTLRLASVRCITQAHVPRLLCMS